MASPTSTSNFAASTAPTEAMEPSVGGGVRVDSLSFCRLECDHNELFLSEYKRSNRTKGLKILRCFPHCCPNHIERSYCGSSLHVIVQTTPSGSGASGSGNPSNSGSSATRAKLADSVLLFARFECSSDDGLRVGDTLPSGAVARATQSEDNPEGTWIPGLKERASALASAMKRVSQAIAEHTLVYQLNGKVYSRWYYDWESGANKAQRLMRHVLKAYVFERAPDDALRVIGVISSPEFTVISYRRAPSEGQAPVKPDAASREPSPPRGASLDAYDHHAKRYRPILSGEPLDTETKRRRRPPGASAPPPPRLLTLRNATPPELFEDRVLWEHANARLVTVSKNLALVFFFGHWTPLDYYASFVDELVHTVNHKVLEPLVMASGDQKLEKLNAFARVLLDHAHSQPTSRHRGMAPPPMTRQLDGLLRAMAQAAVWFYSDEMRWWTRAFLQRHAHALTDKTQLRTAFLQWLVDLEAQLNRVVFAHHAPQLPSLDDAAEEIIAAVYTHEVFHHKRPLVRQILGEHGFIGWRAFVAQMRDSFIALSSAATRDQRLGLANPSLPLHPVERAWNSDWVMDVDESAWKPQDAASHADGLSLVTVLDLMTSLARVQVTLSLTQRLLCIKSHAAFATADAEALKLVLDGKSRVFRFSPHGWSTAMGEGSDGDYIGSTRFEPGGSASEPDRLIAYVETFRWSRLPGTRSFHTRLRIECWKQQRLFVNGEVLETVSTGGFPREELPFLPERTIGAKLKMVNRVAMHHHHHQGKTPLLTNLSSSMSGAAAAGGPSSPATAWRRLGGFRLVYGRARK